MMPKMPKIPQLTFWQFMQSFTAILVAALGAWLFNGVNDLRDRINIMEANERENKAQWNILYGNRKRLEKTEVEIAVTQRIFKILLDQKKIDVSTLTLEGVEPPKSVQVQRIEEFKVQQMRQAK